MQEGKERLRSTMQRTDLIAALRKAEVIYALPHKAAEPTAEQTRELIDNGVSALSIAARSPETGALIAAAVSESKGIALIGAGGVTDTHTARAAILSGADFVSTPYLNTEIVQLCHRYGKVCIPGALSVTEVLRALESGCQLVGLYPAHLFGPKLLKAIKGPLPQADLVPSGGLSAREAKKWIRAGAAAVEVELDGQ